LEEALVRGEIEGGEASELPGYPKIGPAFLMTYEEGLLVPKAGCAVSLPFLSTVSNTVSGLYRTLR